MMLLPYVISSRVRLARNLRGHRFPNVAGADERRAVLDCVQAAVTKMAWADNVAYFAIDLLSPLERRVLEEEQLISAFLATPQQHRLAIIANAANFSILVNEEDHLRIQAIQPGMQLRQTWQTIKKIETSLKKQLDFAYSEQDGYLTTCPSNLGRGMRASVMLFLPGLVMLKRLTAILQKVAAAGYAVRGMSGEGSPSQGCLLQISRRCAYREKEARMLQSVEKTCRKIIAAEQRARAHLLTRHGQELGDYFQRARQTLAMAPQMTLNAGMQMLAALRLALALRSAPAHLGEMTGARKNRSQMFKKIDKLFRRIQPAHILQAGLREPPATHSSDPVGCGCQDMPEDVLRAKVLQAELGMSGIAD